VWAGSVAGKARRVDKECFGFDAIDSVLQLVFLQKDGIIVVANSKCTVVAISSMSCQDQDEFVLPLQHGSSRFDVR
jgi:hypothetical protein